MLQNLELEAALDLLLDLTGPVGSECVPLEEALGRVLAEEVVAKTSLPPFNRSPLDGYALRAEDTQGASAARPVVLTVVEEIPAGFWPRKSLGPGEAARIFTGAPVPPGANAVVRQEDTERAGGLVKVKVALKQGDNLSRIGEDVAKGQVVLSPGRRLTSREIALLAALGHSPVRVYERPRVAILATGEELVDLYTPLLPGKVRNANIYALAAGVREAGGEPFVLGTARDRAEEIATFLERGLAVADLVLSTGGVSVGDYDLVRQAYRLLGAEELFWKLKIKPGTPTAAAQKKGKILLGLSGNPAAALVSFDLLARPLIARLAGEISYACLRVPAVLEKGFGKRCPQRRFVRALAWWEEGWRAEPVGLDGPAVLSSLVQANALLDLPAGSGPLPAGAGVEAVLVRGGEGWGIRLQWQGQVAASSAS